MTNIIKITKEWFLNLRGGSPSLNEAYKFTDFHKMVGQSVVESLLQTGMTFDEATAKVAAMSDLEVQLANHALMNTSSDEIAVDTDPEPIMVFESSNVDRREVLLTDLEWAIDIDIVSTGDIFPLLDIDHEVVEDAFYSFMKTLKAVVVDPVNGRDKCPACNRYVKKDVSRECKRCGQKLFRETTTM